MKATGMKVPAMLLAAIIVLLILPLTTEPVYAEDYQLWVGGEQVTSTNKVS